MQFDEVKDKNALIHYGILRRSGRYPWGSGRNQNTRNKDFLDYVSEMKSKGLTEAEIARGIGMMVGDKVTTADLRAAESIAKNEIRASKIAMANRLRNERGWSHRAIAERMGESERTVGSWLSDSAKDRANILHNTADALKKEVEAKPYLDVGRGAEHYLGVSRTRMDNALAILKQEGYSVHIVPIRTAAGNDTKTKILVKPGVTQKDAFVNRHQIQQIQTFSDDGGRTFGHLHEPLAINPKRVGVVYKEDGGDKADGVIYVRPGVKDVDLGGNRYAQVRVAVGKDHYLKGMAIYSDHLPEGTDLEFHTSKSRPESDNKLDVMKKNADEPGYSETGVHPLLKSVTKQIVANPGTPKERVTSAMNLVNEEESWTGWSKSLSSQMLSKQSPTLVRTQLDLTYERRKDELDSIMKLTNPEVRKKLLEEYASSTDAAAVHLKAAALPRTANHAILPLKNIKPNEIYAPNYNDGEKVVLIRHPHGGTFEIPELIVNNKNREGRNLIGDTRGAVGIHHSVASHLSGADFDGDTVLVIPNNSNKVKNSRPLDELKDFDPRASYPAYPGMKRMRNTQTEMGKISNLITDMTIQNASHAELARAVKHSMVVIDAEKHNLNYKLSEEVNGIKQLKAKYQTGGASTLVSRAGAEIRIPERKPQLHGKGGPVNLRTGELQFEPTNRIGRDGKPVTQKIKRLAYEPDAHKLMSNNGVGTPIERLYADHSNKMKVLANRARLEVVHTPNIKVSQSAKKAYKPQVDSIVAKLHLAERNAPLERQAQIVAGFVAAARINANPAMSDDTKRKIRYQALVQARDRTGASRLDIRFTPDEWDAIQAGAISSSRLRNILNKADMDNVRELATPKREVLMTTARTARAKAMLESGATRTEVARALGVSLTTLDLATKEG